jgi:hypothetical protein
MNEIPKVVFSKTLKRAEWAETRIASGDLAEEVKRLKAEPGNDLIAYGGARLDQSLTRLGLVDEFRLMVQPAALGAGLPLFKDLPQAAAARARRGDDVPDGTRHPHLPAAVTGKSTCLRAARSSRCESASSRSSAPERRRAQPIPVPHPGSG